MIRQPFTIKRADAPHRRDVGLTLADWQAARERRLMAHAQRVRRDLAVQRRGRTIVIERATRRRWSIMDLARHLGFSPGELLWMIRRGRLVRGRSFGIKGRPRQGSYRPVYIYGSSEGWVSASMAARQLKRARNAVVCAAKVRGTSAGVRLTYVANDTAPIAARRDGYSSATARYWRIKVEGDPGLYRTVGEVCSLVGLGSRRVQQALKAGEPLRPRRDAEGRWTGGVRVQWVKIELPKAEVSL